MNNLNTKDTGKHLQKRKGFFSPAVWIIAGSVLAVLLLLLLLFFLLSGGNGDMEDEAPDDSDPSENSILYHGTYIPIQPDVPKNDYDREAFSYEDGFIYYDSNSASSGIDVSSHQGEIDWAQVADAGIDFAIIRVGYRGMVEGGLFLDDYFAYNMENALANGIRVGVYFFSQATTEKEAEEEAALVLEAIEPYDVTYPVVFDWEPGKMENARTENMSGDVLNGCAAAFCAQIQAAGYIPAVYFNLDTGYMLYDPGIISDYCVWFAQYDQTPDYYYEFSIWQYSCTGTVPGISTAVDLDLSFVRF